MLTIKEQLAIKAILFSQDLRDVDEAFLMCHNTKSTDKAIIHKMALRWLREPEVVKYIDEECGYHSEIVGGEKVYFRNEVVITADMCK